MTGAASPASEQLYVVVVNFTVHEGQQHAFSDAVCENARISLELEPGCLQFDVCQDPGAPTRFFLYEVYTTEAAFQDHLRRPHFTGFAHRTQPWVKAKQIETYHRLQGSGVLR